MGNVFALSACLLVCLSAKQISAITFEMVHNSNFIYMSIPWGNIYSLVPRSRSSVKVKVKYQDHSFQKKKGHLCFTKNIVFCKVTF